MDSASPKKKNEAASVSLSAPELTGERELGLARNFEDPSLSDLIPGLGAEPMASDGEAQGSVVHETVAAVEELLREASQQTQETLPQAPIMELPSELFDFSQAEDPVAAPAVVAVPPSDGELPFTTELALPHDPSAAADLALPDSKASATDAFFDPSLAHGQLPADGGTAGAPLDFGGEATLFPVEALGTSVNDTTRVEMAEKLFQLVACEKSFDDLTEAVLSVVMNTLNAQAGSLLELDCAQQEYFFRASIGGGDPALVKSFRIPAGKGIVGHVAESRQPLLLRDMGSDEKQLRAISMSVGFETKTCLAAPLIVGGQLYGVLELFNRKDGNVFDERDLTVLNEGVRMAGKVLEVRFLMAELARRLR